MIGVAVAKGRVRGYYRRDPRTGKRVWVRPHVRKDRQAPRSSDSEHEMRQLLRSIDEAGSRLERALAVQARIGRVERRFRLPDGRKAKVTLELYRWRGLTLWNETLRVQDPHAPSRLQIAHADDAKLIKQMPDYAEARATAERRKGLYEQATQLVERARQRSVEAQRRALEFARAHGQHVFIRWGDPPPGGRSRDYREGTLEPGVAVYHAYRFGSLYIVPADGIDAASALFIAGSGPMYEVEGKVVGTTSDGTPAVELRRARKITGAEWRFLASGTR